MCERYKGASGCDLATLSERTMLSISPSANSRHSRALERLHARTFPTTAREDETSRETIAIDIARARRSTRRLDRSRRGVNRIASAPIDST